MLTSFRELDLSHNPLEPSFQAALLAAWLAQYPPDTVTQSNQLLHFVREPEPVYEQASKLEADSQDVDLHALLADLDF